MMDQRSSDTIEREAEAEPAEVAIELFSEAGSVEVVAASFAATSDPRLRRVMVSSSRTCTASSRMCS